MAHPMANLGTGTEQVLRTQALHQTAMFPASISAWVGWDWWSFPHAFLQESMCEINEPALPMLGNLFRVNEIQLMPSCRALALLD